MDFDTYLMDSDRLLHCAGAASFKLRRTDTLISPDIGRRPIFPTDKYPSPLGFGTP